MFEPLPVRHRPAARPVSRRPLFEHNWLIGAAPGQGKTSAVRVLACAAALDPLAELWVHELAGKGDLEPLAQVATGTAPGWTTRRSATRRSRCGCCAASWSARSASFKKLPKEARPDGKITRDMAARPVSSGCTRWSASSTSARTCSRTRSTATQATDDAAYVIRLGRAYGIILVLATQRPDSQTAADRRSAGNVTRPVLPEGPRPGRERHDPGHARATRTATTPTVFRPKIDAGLGWLKAEGDPQVCRTYYLDLPAAERIAERARVLRDQAGTLTGYALGEDDGQARRGRSPPTSWPCSARPGQAVDATIAARLAEQLPARLPRHHRGRGRQPAARHSG